jgi:mannosyltransferase
MNRARSISPILTALIMVGAILLGAGLRLHLLGTHSLWIDEAASVRFATLPWRPFLHTLWSYQGNMTLYYFLLRAWMHLGDSEFMVRSLGVLFGVLTIPAMYLLGKQLFDRMTGLTAAALLSVHSFHVLWSQQARAYSLLLLLLVLTAYFLVRAMESNDNFFHWGVFATVAALSVYAHVFAVLVLAAHAISILFPKPYRVSTRNILLTAILFEHLIAPMAIFVLINLRSSQLNWVVQPSWQEFWGFLQLLTSQGGKVLVVLYFTLCSLAFFSPAGVEKSEKEGWSLRLMALWLILPPVLTLAISPIKAIFDPGFMVVCVPALVMLAARGLTKFTAVSFVRSWPAFAAFVVVMLLSLASNARPPRYPITRNADWRSAVNYVLDHEEPGDGAVFYVPNVYPYVYYARRAEERQHRASAAPEVLYPPNDWQPLSREEIKTVTSGHRRVWLILHNETFNPNAVFIMESTLRERFGLLDEHVFSGEAMPIKVKLYGPIQAVQLQDPITNNLINNR